MQFIWSARLIPLMRRSNCKLFFSRGVEIAGLIFVGITTSSIFPWKCVNLPGFAVENFNKRASIVSDLSVQHFYSKENISKKIKKRKKAKSTRDNFKIIFQLLLNGSNAIIIIIIYIDINTCINIKKKRRKEW